jgi:hypothetical protein
MKKIYVVLVLLAAAVSCHSQAKSEWYDNDTLRITADGTIEEEAFEYPAVRRREMACNSAKLNAMADAINILGEAGSDSVSDVKKDGDRFSAFVRGGSVISSSFNPESNKCTVVYELKEKNLKKKAGRV